LVPQRATELRVLRRMMREELRELVESGRTLEPAKSARAEIAPGG
jgi:hypothetical protein